MIEIARHQQIKHAPAVWTRCPFADTKALGYDEDRIAIFFWKERHGAPGRQRHWCATCQINPVEAMFNTRHAFRLLAKAKGHSCLSKSRRLVTPSVWCALGVRGRALVDEISVVLLPGARR